MMYDKLIKALRCESCMNDEHPKCESCEYGVLSFHGKHGDVYGCDARRIDNVAANAIEELISRVPKWISVNEKLPNSQRPVLVYVPESEGFYEYVGMADYTWSPKGGFWCGTDGETYGAIGFIRTPTHWCELPEPPKGEKND